MAQDQANGIRRRGCPPVDPRRTLRTAQHSGSLEGLPRRHPCAEGAAAGTRQKNTGNRRGSKALPVSYVNAAKEWERSLLLFLLVTGLLSPGIAGDHTKRQQDEHTDQKIAACFHCQFPPFFLHALNVVVVFLNESLILIIHIFRKSKCFSSYQTTFQKRTLAF